ncbi:MAG: hypothetical protein ACRCUZ_10760, partial [Shewanella sp.]
DSNTNIIGVLHLLDNRCQQFDMVPITAIIIELLRSSNIDRFYLLVFWVEFFVRFLSQNDEIY